MRNINLSSGVLFEALEIASKAEDLASLYTSIAVAFKKSSTLPPFSISVQDSIPVTLSAGDEKEFAEPQFIEVGNNRTIASFLLPRARSCIITFEGMLDPHREGISESLQSLSYIIRVALDSFLIHRHQATVAKRQGFYNSILGVAPTIPEVDIQATCGAWLSATNCSAVWLFLKNTHLESEPWELVAAVPIGPNTPRRITYPPGSLLDYCLNTNSPLSISSVQKWKATWSNQTYSSFWDEELAAMRCQRLDCIPLLKPVLPPRPDSLPLNPCPLPEGAILLAYGEDKTPTHQPDESLILMGRMTALAIFNSYQAEQRMILVTLNKLAEKYLTRATKAPLKLRHDYLSAVIELIKNWIHVKAVSIFYRDITNIKIECLATTGICDASLRVVASDSLSNVTYGIGEGLTGQCFQIGKPLVIPDALPSDHKPKFLEMPIDENYKTTPVIIYPIPSPAGNAGPCSGVIRCALHGSPLIPNGNRRFDLMEMQTLGFIASQLAPVLHTMDTNIKREQIISITKHDLRAPLQMLRGTLAEFELGKDASSRQQLILKNSKNGIDVALALVDQLEPDPEEVKDFDPKNTHLEGDIVARLKSMLSHVAFDIRKMKISFGSFQEIPSVKVDRSLIERALSNLVMNAIKYGTPETEISIVPRSYSDGIRIHVINYGIGLEADEVQHIFKANYRSPRSRSLAMGSGLGLTIAKAAMEKHGGRLEVTHLKNPTVFSMFFPRSLIINE